jgi:hypothetical protein
LSRVVSYSHDQDHIHPDISTTPILGVCKNMLFCPKNLTPTLGEDPKKIIGFRINAPILWLIPFQVYYILGQRHGVMQNKNLKKRKKKNSALTTSLMTFVNHMKY